jgi:hypothetical protein
MEKAINIQIINQYQSDANVFEVALSQEQSG